MDSLACPYISEALKKKLLKKYGVSDEELQKKVIEESEQQQWFTKWKNFDFRKELDAKQSREVY